MEVLKKKKKKDVINQSAFYPDILQLRINFLLIPLNSKVKCWVSLPLRLNLKSNTTISSNQIMKLDIR